MSVTITAQRTESPPPTYSEATASGTLHIDPPPYKPDTFVSTDLSTQRNEFQMTVDVESTTENRLELHRDLDFFEHCRRFYNSGNLQYFYLWIFCGLLFAPFILWWTRFKRCMSCGDGCCACRYCCVCYSRTGNNSNRSTVDDSGNATTFEDTNNGRLCFCCDGTGSSTGSFHGGGGSDSDLHHTCHRGDDHAAGDHHHSSHNGGDYGGDDCGGGDSGGGDCGGGDSGGGDCGGGDSGGGDCGGEGGGSCD